MADISQINLPNDNNTYNIADLVARGLIWQGTQAQYDAITTKDPNVVYFITDGTTVACASNEVTYDHTVSGLSATDVKGALDELASEKMDKSNPTGNGKLSLNREVNSTEGDYSVAIGYDCLASGDYSYAEGYDTSAIGAYSHSEGYQSTASGIVAHAEGYKTKASGNYSYAEGAETKASGNYSHAEGYKTESKSVISHAEGSETTAEGFHSHAEGTGTIANHWSQHVFGQYNIADTSTNVASQRGNYVEIVGNGGDNNTRSNARTLDWNGNETLAGDLTINGSTSVGTALSNFGGLKAKVNAIAGGSSITVNSTVGFCFATYNNNEAVASSFVFSNLANTFRFKPTYNAQDTRLTATRDATTGNITITNNSGVYASIIVLYF